MNGLPKRQMRMNGGPKNGELRMVDDHVREIEVPIPVYTDEMLPTYVRGPWWRFWRRLDYGQPILFTEMSGFVSGHYRRGDDPWQMDWHGPIHPGAREFDE